MSFTSHAAPIGTIGQVRPCCGSFYLCYSGSQSALKGGLFLMTQQVLSSSSDGAVTLSVRTRIEWRYALGLITTAFFLLGASVLFGVVIPTHLYIAKWIASMVTFGWLLGVRKLGLFPSGWDRARGSSFSFLQALIEGFAFFVFMLAVMS